jgi:plasmid replication initiation protein
MSTAEDYVVDGPPAADVPTDPVELDRFIDWRLRRIRQEREQQLRNTDIARAEIERYTKWLDEANATHQHSIDYLTEQVRMAVLSGYDFGKKKSRKLPNGTIGFSLKGGGVSITDMAAAVAFAREVGIEVKESVGVSKVKEYMESTGKPLPFVEVEEKRDVFYVKVEG